MTGQTAHEVCLRFTREQWFLLPLKMRQKWWKETEYGKIPPSRELQTEIEMQLKSAKEA